MRDKCLHRAPTFCDEIFCRKPIDKQIFDHRTKSSKMFLQRDIALIGCQERLKNRNGPRNIRFVGIYIILILVHFKNKDLDSGQKATCKGNLGDK